MSPEKDIVETHPLAPFLPEGAKLLMLGSFPPPRARWSMDFFYPNLQNDMWRIMGLLFYGDREAFLMPGRKAFDAEAIGAFCAERGIALYDTASEVVRLRGNASDNHLQIAKPSNLDELLAPIPGCRALAVTGQKAADTLLEMIECKEPPVGGSEPFVFGGREMTLWRMPSSSRAYPKPIEEKAEAYRKMFLALNML